MTPKAEGFRCPECGSSQTSVSDSRSHEDGRRRRRLCESCGCKFSTIEMTIKDYKALQVTAVLDVRHKIGLAIDSYVVEARRSQCLAKP